jgi:hypothetical protein
MYPNILRMGAKWRLATCSDEFDEPQRLPALSQKGFK